MNINFTNLPFEKVPLCIKQKKSTTNSKKANLHSQQRVLSLETIKLISNEKSYILELRLQNQLSHHIRKQACIGENKGADQLCSNCFSQHR